MTAFMDGFAVACIPFVGVLALIALAGAAEYIWEICTGLEPVPYRLSRRYWRRKFVRLVCRLAEIEVAWEQRKSPRKAATKRGTVGQRVRRSACMYSQIIPQSAGNVKSDFAVAWKWMRG